MSALDFAAHNVQFRKSSPLTGPFDIDKLPMLRKPLLRLDDINCKQMVIYKASSATGTVFLEIASAYRLSQRAGDMLIVAQTDDDAKQWTRTRAPQIILSCDPVKALLSNDKYALTQDLWLFLNHFCIVTGPGENAQQSKQVRYLHTDESHCYKAGALSSFDKRLGGRWDRSSLHVSTAADEGAEIDLLYFEGDQNEWHHRCLKCGKLFWMLWHDTAKDFYGKQIFRSLVSDELSDSGGSAPPATKVFDTDSHNRVVALCPHCAASYADTFRERRKLCADGDYIGMNPNASPQKASYRWNVFAAYWIEWATIRDEWDAAIAAAKLGNLSKHEDFQKKRECRSYKPTIPDLGEHSPHHDYRIGEVWITNYDKRRVCSFDVQDKGGLHFWAQCDEFLANGDSRRVAYSRLQTWEQCREFQLYQHVDSSDTGCDYGHRDREVFSKCAQWKWYALKSTGDDTGSPMDFVHYITDRITKKQIEVRKPFSMTQPQDSMTGKSGKTITLAKGLPPGWCLSRLWSKAAIGFILLALKSGQSGRYYGIASDLTPEYTAQLNSYVEAIEKVKRTNTDKRILRQVRTEDHSFSTSSQNLLLAIIAGFFPMDFAKEEQATAPA